MIVLKVGLLGYGAIGSQVAAALESNAAPGAELAGVFDLQVRHPQQSVDSMAELIQCSDLVVEAAGHEALNLHGAGVRRGGTDLLVVSVGALADAELLAELRNPAAQAAGDSAGSPQLGRLYLTTGAIGGLDTLRAAALLGPIESVAMTSTKPAANLCRPWMEAELQTALLEGGEPTVAFAGPAREACGLFPESANVCATLALATVGFEQTQVVMVGDPQRESVRHEIEVTAASGSYSFAFENRVSEANSKTSAIVPFAVVRALRDLTESDGLLLL